MSVGYFHRDNNIYTKLFSTNLKQLRDRLLPGSRSWTQANEQLTAFLDVDVQKETKRCIEPSSMPAMQCSIPGLGSLQLCQRNVPTVSPNVPPSSADEIQQVNFVSCL